LSQLLGKHRDTDQRFVCARVCARACASVLQDEFQVKFWKLRQNEYSPYTVQYSPVIIRPGQLTDPLYFDFINYIQYALLAKEMPKGRMVFEEFCEIEEECPGTRKRVVKRDQRLSDNSLLPAAMEAGIGDKIYFNLANGFEGLEFGAPKPLGLRHTFAELVGAVEALVKVFVENGYAIKGEVTGVQADATRGRGRFSVRMQAPCTLWGLQRLGSQKAPLVNALDAMTVQAFLRASGREASYTLQVNDSSVESQWIVGPARDTT